MLSRDPEHSKPSPPPYNALPYNPICLHWLGAFVMSSSSEDEDLDIYLFTLHILGLRLPRSYLDYILPMPRRYYKKAEILSWESFQVLPFTVLAGNWHLGNSLFPTDALSLYSDIHSFTIAVSFFPFCPKQPLQEVFPSKRPSDPEGCGNGGNK